METAIDLKIESPLNDREHINLAIATGVSGDYQEMLFELNKIMQHHKKSKIIVPFSFWVCFDTAIGFSSLMEEAVTRYFFVFSFPGAGFVCLKGFYSLKFNRVFSFHQFFTY